jgi:hypothetical protein
VKEPTSQDLKDALEERLTKLTERDRVIVLNRALQLANEILFFEADVPH